MRYWDEQQNEVKTRFLGSAFLGEYMRVSGDWGEFCACMRLVKIECKIQIPTLTKC